jgi:hypothetical protein
MEQYYSTIHISQCKWYIHFNKLAIHIHTVLPRCKRQMPTISSKYTYHIDARNLPVLPTHSISQWLLGSLDKSVRIMVCQWASKYRVPFLAGSRLFYFSFLQSVQTNYRGQEWVELYLWLHGVHRNISIFHHSDYQICYFTLHKTCKSNAEILIYETIINHGVYWNVKKNPSFCWMYQFWYTAKYNACTHMHMHTHSYTHIPCIYVLTKKPLCTHLSCGFVDASHVLCTTYHGIYYAHVETYHVATHNLQILHCTTVHSVHIQSHMLSK